MRVLHLIQELCLGGAQTVVLDLANHFTGKNCKTAVCTLVSKGALTPRLNQEKVKLFELGKQPGNDMSISWRMANIFKQWQPDIVHTHCWGSLVEGFIAAKLARVPVIIHSEHGTIEERWRNVYVQKALWHLHNQIIAVSKEHKQRLMATIGFPEQKIQVIYNGIDTNHFTKLSSQKRKEKRYILGLDENDLIVGTVGRLEPVKDQANLLHAFQKVNRTLPNTKLLLVGEGRLRNELTALAQSLALSDSVLFLGIRDDVDELLGIMDLFVLPSKSEGTSCTLLEAMSCKLPVVVTEVGGNPEVIKENHTGVLVPKENSKALAHSIINLLCKQEKCTQMGKAGQKRIESQFSIKKMLENHFLLYEKFFLTKNNRP